MPIANTIFPSVIQQYPRFDLNRRQMVTIPGGVFAMGSFFVDLEHGNAKPRMVQVDSFAADVHHVTEADYRRIVGKPGDPKAKSLQHPVTYISARDAANFIVKANEGKQEFEQIRLLTEKEIEYMTRGPAVDVRELMETRQLRNAANLIEYLNPKNNPDWELENFVDALALGAQIIVGPYQSYRDAFVQLIDSRKPIFAWRVHGTESGRLNTKGHFLKSGASPVSLTERLNGYGISDSVGNVWTWSSDIYTEPSQEPWPNDPPIFVLRGGSWYRPGQIDLLAGHRSAGHIDHSNATIGLRIGASAQEN